MLYMQTTLADTRNYTIIFLIVLLLSVTVPFILPQGVTKVGVFKPYMQRL